MRTQSGPNRTGVVAVVSFVLAALAVVACIVWWPRAGVDHADVASSPGAAAVPAQVDASTGHLPQRHLQRTATGTYAMVLDVALDVVAGAKAERQELAFTAELQFAVPATPVGRGWIAGRIRNLRADGDPKLARQFGATDDGVARRGFIFGLRTDPSGAIVDHRFEPGTPAPLRNAIQTLATGMQVVAAKSGPARTWSGVEQTHGAALAMAYDTDDAGRVHKRWRRGTPDSAPDGPEGEGHSTLAFDAHGLVAAHYAYRLAVDLTLHSALVQKHAIAATLGLQRTAQSGFTPGEPAWAAAAQVQTLPTDAQLQPVPQQAATAPTPRTAAAVVAASEAAHAKRDWQARQAASGELKANLDSQPGMLAEVLAQLRLPGRDGNALRTLVDGLAYADNSLCRKAYVAAMTDATVPYLARHALVSAASFVAKPDAALLTALRKLAETNGHELQAAALLAWAAQGNLQRDRNPVLGSAIAEAILARATPWLQPETDVNGAQHKAAAKDETDIWIEALGNLGGEEVWPLVEKWLVAKNERQRLHAIESLRFVPVPEARLALALAMQKDPRPRNRRRATEIAQYHPQAAMEEPVLRALRDDPAAAVRIGAAGTIAVWSVTSTGLLDELKEAEKRELVPHVKKVLAQLQPETLKDPPGAKP